MGIPWHFAVSPTTSIYLIQQVIWIGWFPWGNEDALDQQGNYLGTVVGNRFLARVSPIFRGYPGYPGYPGYAGYPGYPGFAGYAGYISGFTDIDLNRLKGR